MFIKSKFGMTNFKGGKRPIPKSILHAVFFLILLLVASTFSRSAFAWPVESDWIAIQKGDTAVDDPAGDASGSRDIVGDSTYPAAYLFTDGDYLYYRIRLNDDPIQSGYLRPFGWGFIIDTDSNASDYEYMVMIDGISDEIYIAENSVKTGIGDPSDKAEVIFWVEALNNDPSTGNFRVTVADSAFGGDSDYFLDFRLPYATFLAQTGITESTPIRYFMGSSNSAQTLASDLCGASSLYGGLSDNVIPSGTEPATGTVKFVSDLAGNGDVTLIYPGNTIFIRVDDGDRNSIRSVAQSITVTLTAPSGDMETVTLTETGADTGIFTGSIATSYGAASAGDGTLQVEPIENVTVTYVDSIDALLNEDQSRTDVLTVNPMADLSVSKTVNNSIPNEGDTITYTITILNNGPTPASGIQVTDTLPAGVTYISDDGGGSYNGTTGIWTPGPLAPAASATLNINATVDSGTQSTTITNNAAITSAGQYDPSGGNNSASASITVGGIDIAITKTVDTATPNEGASITYTITASNGGSNGATGVGVADLLPAGVTYVSDNGGGAYDSVSGLWSVGAIASGASGTLNITATVNAGTSGSIITNLASLSASDQPDSNGGNNSGSALVAVGGADLSITKAVDDPSPKAGGSITYTLTVTNNSSNGATGVQATDLLPAGITYVSDDGGGAYVSATGVWSVGAVAGGASRTLNITATVNAGTGGSIITNNAAITASDQSDPAGSNNSASASITVQKADLELTKAVSTATPDEGQNFDYIITVINKGTDTASAVSVTDLLPAGVTYISDDGGGAYASATGVWSVGAITSGSSSTLNITARPNAGTSGSVIRNTAGITASDQSDPVSSNNSDYADITITGIDLAITKAANKTTPAPGEAVTYTVVITNNGPYSATNVEVTDCLPSGVTYVSYTATQGSYNKSSCVWDAGSLGVWGSATLTINVTVNAGTSGQTITNRARISASDQTDINIANDNSEIAILVGGADLRVTKSVDNGTPNAGGTIVYTLTVTNNGSNNATGVVLQDILPSGVTYVSDDGGGAYVAATGLWSVGAISTGASASLNITATVDAGTGGSSILNIADINASDQVDPDTTNNSQSASITVQSADLAVTKTVSDSTPTELDTIIYTLTLTNNGPHTATAISVSDVIPAGLTYLSDDGGGAYDNVTGLWTVASLAKLSSATLNITVRVNIGTGGTTITNTASISASDQEDPNAGNNSSSIAISPASLPAVPDIIMLKSGITYSDPYNGTTNPKAIPGASMLYTVMATNQGLGTAESVVITDPVPANTELFVGDIGGGQGPVSFTDGTPASGLAYSFLGLGDATDSLEFSNNGGGSYDYTPVPDADGYDENVTDIRISLSGLFSASDGVNHPNFTVRFRVRVK